MLTTVLASIFVFAVLFAGMAIGVIVANKPVKGSCGGMSAVGLDGECDVCGGNPSRCDAESGAGQGRNGRDAAGLAHNALRDG